MSSTRQEVVLVIDNSLSTQQRSSESAESEQKTVFDELLARAGETVAELQPGSAVRVLTTSPYPAWVTPASLRVDAAYSHVFIPKTSVALTDDLTGPEAGRGNLNADYKSSIDLIGLQAKFTF